jgi:hypothetical protein
VKHFKDEERTKSTSLESVRKMLCDHRELHVGVTGACKKCYEANPYYSTHKNQNP